MPRPATNRWTSELFGTLSWRAKLQFFVAVFFTFVPVATMFALAREGRVPWLAVAAWACFSGLTAVGWAFAFTLSRKLLFLVVPLSWLLPMLFGRGFWGIGLGKIPVLVLTLAAIALGYGFFIHFISNEGVTSLRLRTEMGLARQIHAGLVPPVNLATSAWEIYGDSSPTTEVGGDLLDVHAADGRAGIYVADVSGHGVPAGVFMAMIKSAIRTRLLGAHVLETLVADLNEVLVQVTGPSMFATFACLHVEAPRRVTVALAGHLPVLHLEAATGLLHLVHNEHPPLGIVAGQRFATTAVAAGAGDLFVLFTDGLTEVRNEAGQEFGEERLRRLVAENAQRPLAALHAALLGAVRDFGPKHDDQTLVLMRLL